MSFRLAHDADPLPHLPVEHGRNGEGVGCWVPEMKHTFLAKYVEGTRRAREKFKQRVYVDLFPDGHPNSPAYGHLKLPHLN